jgi:two-component system, NarL family, sensor kinase
MVYSTTNLKVFLRVHLKNVYCANLPFCAGVLLLFVSFCFVRCSSEETPDPAHSNLIDYLEKPGNLTQPAYKDSFQTNVDRLLQKGDLDKTVQVLEAHGNALDLAFLADSGYAQTTEDFLKKHQSELSDYQIISLSYYLGSQYDFLGDIDKSNDYLLKTQIPAESKEALELRAFGRVLLSEHYKLSGKYYEAMTPLLKNISYFEDVKDTINLATTYNNLSLVYKNLKVYDESEKYLKKSLELSKQLNDTLNIWIAYVNLSRPNSLAVEPRKCLKYAKLAKSIFEHWSEKTNYYSANTYSTYANALLVNRKMDSVSYYIAKAEKYVEGENRMKFDLLQMQAETDLLQGKPARNSTTLEKEYIAAKQRNDIPVLEMLATVLSDNAKRNNDYPTAYNYLAEKYRIRDSSWMNDTKLHLIFLDKKFQVEKKEKLIAQQQLKIARTNSFIYGTISLVIVLLSLWIIFAIRKRRKRAEREAHLQEQFTFQLLQSTEEERSRIANELHDSVNHELLTIKNALVNGKPVDITHVSSVIDEVRSISRNLHPAVLETIGLEASIEQMCERLTENGLFATAEIHYEKPETKPVELQLYRIIQEALNNTLKHGNANAAKVSLIQSESGIFIEIKDNGTGFDVNKQLNSPKSFGLHSLFQRAKSISCSLSISSSNKGTSVQLVKNF